MIEFHCDRTIKSTRKPHRCEQCNTMIDAGSPAHYGAGKFDGYFYSHHCHVECHAAAYALAEETDCWAEDFPWFQHMSETDHHEWLLTFYPIVADRLSIVPLEFDR
ncbi:hypothetical protein [Rhizobium sp. BG4]|uniref:hypothetical protein n=1 Tax=Rhizobium sp. BG4 TaxID=2613770 RepID=UPI00193DBCD0|nr:hypothetical protein [Rhizobium sp. BG4]QRM44010.1 hypothetical protein F2982_11440 [Rhizobium sp. BG4]